MTWNHRIIINEDSYPDGEKEFSATVHEVFYNLENQVGYSGSITPIGTGETKEQALKELHFELKLMMEAVELVIDGKTMIFDYNDIKTHIPGEPSILVPRYNVIDPDDDYMNEKYDE